MNLPPSNRLIQSMMLLSNDTDSDLNGIPLPQANPKEGVYVNRNQGLALQDSICVLLQQ